MPPFVIVTGFADWQFYSSTHRRKAPAAATPNPADEQRALANSEWQQALHAGLLDYAAHWRTFDSMLHDCKENVSLADPSRPCFNWRTPYPNRAPTIVDAERCAAPRLARMDLLDGVDRQLKGNGTGSLSPFARLRGGTMDGQRMCVPVTPTTCMWSLPMPSNGTLSAVIECAHRFARGLAPQKQPGATQPGATQPGATQPGATQRDAWGVFAMGDAPGFMSLVDGHPGLHGRVVHTNDAGGVAHTTFTASCPQNSDACVTRGTVDPQGGWTRAMIDYYVGGLTDGFVSSLFSSFVGAVLRRSMTCCKERYHFGAMYSQQRSHRDKPMRNINFLRAMMQDKEQKVGVHEWPPP